MSSLRDRRVIVTGGTAGLGLGIVEAMVRHGAVVTVVARGADRLDQLRQRLGVSVLVGDVADREFTKDAILQVSPEVIILNAGATPAMGPIHQMSWEDFSRVWDSDVKAALYWVQASLQLPLPRGSRVLLGSSGAAIAGSPLSGGYAGAKRMLWLMAGYANGVSAKEGLGINFQALLPNQIVGGTGVGDAAAAVYARSRGIGTQEFLKGFGPPLLPDHYGDLVAELLTDAKFEGGAAYAFRGDKGIIPLEG